MAAHDGQEFGPVGRPALAEPVGLDVLIQQFIGVQFRAVARQPNQPQPRRVSTNLYMDPAFGATTACHTMNHVKTGLRLYIRPLSGQHTCPGLDEIRARSPH